ncbi:MAG: hypothetical protein ABJA82_10215 [Myxococcales bacterium]
MTLLKLTLLPRLRLRLRLRLCLGLAAVGLLACEKEPADIQPQVVTERAALHAQAVVHESGLALGFTIADGGTVTKIMGSSSNAASSVVSPALDGGMPPTAMLRAMVGPALTQQMTGVQMPSMLTTEERFDDVGNQLRRLMSERLFVDSNLESNSGGTAVYLLHADPTCRPLTGDSDPPGTVPPIDQKCADDFAKVAVRVAVKDDGDGARMTVLIGADRLELVSVVIHSDELAAEVDLPRAKAANDVIQQQLHPDDGTRGGAPAKTYARLAGKVGASLKKVGPQKVTAAWAVLQALDVAPSSGGSVTMAASNPVVALTSDGNTKTAELQVGLGATNIGGTWDPQSTGVSNNDFHLVVGGLYGRLSLQEDAQQIVLTDLGIGASKLTVRGTSIIDLNLNPDAMRRFSGKLSSNNGISRLEVTPLVDLRLAFDYNAIAADFASPPASTIAHESYALTLVNPGAPAVIEEAPSTAGFTGGLKIVAGSLTVGAASVPGETVTVPTGKCLSTTSTVAPGAHPILGKLVVSDCL